MKTSRRVILSLLSSIEWGLCGALGAQAFSPVDLWPCAFISIALLLWCSARSRHPARVGFCWGVGFFLSGLYWIYIVIQHFGALPIPLAVLILLAFVCYLSLYPLLFCWLLNRYFKHTPFIRLVIMAPACWLLLDAFRGMGLLGFPWLTLGYTQLNTPLHDFAPILGVNGLTYLVVLCSGLFIYAIQYRRYLVLGVIIAIFAGGYSLNWVTWVTVNHQKPLKVALVQGNIPDSIQWEPHYLEHTLQHYLELSDNYLGNSQLIVWPEGAIPDTQSDQRYFLTQLDKLGKKQHTSFIIGLFSQQGNKTYNSMIALGASLPPYQENTAQHYYKHHLVPFGEFTPFKHWLQPLMQWFSIPMSQLTPGPYKQPSLQIQGFHFLPAICFDIIFNQQIQANFNSSDDFLLLISNDGWFGHSNAAWQHLQMAQMRSLELGRPMLIDTTNGITAILNAKGAVIQQLPQFISGVLASTVYPTIGTTPFSHWGNIPILIITLLNLTVGCLLTGYRNKYIHQLLATK